MRAHEPNKFGRLMPSTDISIKVDLKSQALYTDCHVENCLTLEVAPRNAYGLQDAIRMRINCKDNDATTLGLIELSYPADKLVNFRLMAQTEMKTETSINCYAEEGSLPARSPRSNLSWQVRELTPMEQLHLHGQHGFGTNIFRGLPPPPSNLKVRIDIVAPEGLWWVCNLGGSSRIGAAAPNQRDNSWSLWTRGSLCGYYWWIASPTTASVFATMEVPRAKKDDRPVALLLGRTEAKLLPVALLGDESDMVETAQLSSSLSSWQCVFHQQNLVKTVPMCASHSDNLSPWDIFASFNCGSVIDHRLREGDTSFSRVSPIEEVMGAGFPKCGTWNTCSSRGEEGTFVRLNLPLRMASGSPAHGVFALVLDAFTKASAALHRLIFDQRLVQICQFEVRSGYDLAALRVDAVEPPLCLPQFEAACHLENGGLARHPAKVDGFVVGLHNLYNFVNLVAASSMFDICWRTRRMSPQGSSCKHVREAANALPVPMGDPLAGITLLSTLQEPCVASGNTFAERRSLGRSSHGSHSHHGPPAGAHCVTSAARPESVRDARENGVSAAITSSGPIGQALLEKVNSVSAKVEAILGTRRAPLSSRTPQSLGEKLVDLTERLGQLEKLLDEFRTRGVFSPPVRVQPTVPARAPSTLSAEAAAEASVKAVAKSLLDAARNRSPSAAKTQMPPSHMQVAPPAIQAVSPGYAVVRRPSQASRSTTPVTTSRLRTPGSLPGSALGSQTNSFTSPPSGGLTPPPGLFLPITSLVTPGFVAAPCNESLAQNANRHLNGFKTPGGSTPRTNLSLFSGTALSWEGRFSPAPPPFMPVSSRSPSINRTSAAPPPFQHAATVQLPPKGQAVQEAEGKIRQWLDTIPIGNGAERGWDDAQIREIAEFSSQQNLGHLTAEHLYQRYVEHQVAEAEASR
ncbi:Ank2 [Symbiodinium pilosum]|uniref:Ank2 protein n=1 Tax=Symbiodinium pilosum TaxID=2952 RepID=A0A812U944_SYMPI|nr:Ank2 [Symbiodinium pilosum]